MYKRHNVTQWEGAVLRHPPYTIHQLNVGPFLGQRRRATVYDVGPGMVQHRVDVVYLLCLYHIISRVNDRSITFLRMILISIRMTIINFGGGFAVSD